jgi:hypothetical protein
MITKNVVAGFVTGTVALGASVTVRSSALVRRPVAATRCRPV